MEQMTKFQAIKTFFSAGCRPVTMDELKALSAEERTVLAILAAVELGVELKSA